MYLLTGFYRASVFKCLPQRTVREDASMLSSSDPVGFVLSKQLCLLSLLYSMFLPNRVVKNLGTNVQLYDKCLNVCSTISIEWCEDCKNICIIYPLIEKNRMIFLLLTFSLKSMIQSTIRKSVSWNLHVFHQKSDTLWH